MEQISIENVLVKFNDTVDLDSMSVKTYGIRVLTKEGDTSEIICRKMTKTPKARTTGQDKRGKQFYNLKANGVLFIEDILAGHPKSVKAAMIYAFQDYQSSTWLKVYH